ncbi:MAG: PorP/SprF family type IX secretion system membrane protein [Paludibacteraceae bacterium]|nr:PorP/SprF family type IX secretion system membrane protein [Paludibacteraceae bacterium]
MMRRKNILAIITLSVIGVVQCVAQDFLLSQPWSATTVIAPSFAGFTNGGKVYAVYRNQWSSIKGSQTGLVSYDQYFHPIRSSFGANLNYTSYATGMLAQLQFNIQYNYAVQMTKDWYFRPGLQIGVFYRTVDPSKATFVDQIAADGSVVGVTQFSPTQSSLVRFDAAVSIMFHGPYFFGGVCADRLLGNNVSFTDQPSTKQYFKLNVFAGGMIPISQGLGKYDPKDDVTIAALYQWQGQYHQIDIDAMYHRKYFMVGVGYRGIPFYSPDGLTSSDAFKVMVGGSFAGFSLSYSYDVSVSKLVNVSGGSHEIVLSYRFLEMRPNDRRFFCY